MSVFNIHVVCVYTSFVVVSRPCFMYPVHSLYSYVQRTQQLPTMLGVDGEQCGVGLQAAKSLTGFKLSSLSNDVDGS